MIRKIQRRWFEVWGDEEAQNRILKYLLLLFAAFCAVELIVITALAFKKPLIVSITDEVTRPLQASDPAPSALAKELMRAITNYLKTRHNWEPATIEARTKAASQYVGPDFREKYLINTQEQIRLAHEKQVSQRLYPEEPQLDMKAKTATVHAERILIVNGIRAAQSLNLEISFTLGERSEANPEGVFITSEKLETTN
jgi:hypothetical protein